MISIAQIKAARLFLNLDQKGLADLSGVSLPTVQRIENPKFGPGRSSVRIIEALKEALESEGVIFLPADASGGEGVRLARTTV